MELLIIIFSVLITFDGFINAENPCKFDEKDGICIPIRQCPPALKVLKNYATSTSKEIQSLRSSQCSSDGKTPWVCCVEPTFKESDFPPHGVCGTQFKDKIIGGQECAPGEYPWMALVGYTKAGESRFLCGGTLITKDYVLTAAHCIGAPKLTGWNANSIRLGEHKLSTDPDCEDDDGCYPPVLNVGIAEIIVHESYVVASTTQHDDIALIRLSQSAVFSSFVKPICLPFDSSVRGLNLEDVTMVVSGFGRTYWANATSSDLKMKVEVNGTNWNQCNNLYARSLKPSQICAGGEEGKDSCKGDSGGPLMIDGKLTRGLPITYLVGVVSRGPRMCGTAGMPGIYTRVDEFLFWIRHNMKHV